MTSVEIIEDTVQYYSGELSTRAIHDGVSHLETPFGRRCAIGRFVRPNCRSEVTKLASEGILLSNVEFYLEDEYQHRPDGFWYDLQDLHDNYIYWAVGELTEEGIDRVKYLKDKYQPY